MRTGIVIATVLALAGCEKGKDAAHPAVARPSSVVFDFARKSSTSLDGMKAFVGAIDPRAAMMADEDMAFRAGGRVFGVTGLSGVDRKSPLHILYVDSKDGTGPVLVVKVGDAGKLDSEKGAAAIEKRGGWAVIGKPELVKQVADYALGSLTGGVPDMPTATLYLHDFMGAHEQDIKQGLEMVSNAPTMQGEMKAFMKSYFDGLLSIARDTDEVRATLQAGDQKASLDVAFVPHAGSKLAAFVAAQKPGDFSLLDKLPAETPAMIMVGNLALGPYHDAFIAAMAQFYKTGGADVSKSFAAIMAATTGSIAVTATFGQQGMAMSQLVPLNDAAAGGAAVDAIFGVLAAGSSIDMGNATARYSVSAAPIEHDGVKLHGLDTTYEPKDPNDPSVLAMQRMMPGLVQHSAVGIADKNIVFVMGSDVQGAAGRAIDAARGKGDHIKLEPSSQALVAESKGHGDSFLALVDMGRMIGAMLGVDRASEPMAFGLGASSGNLHVRIAVPVAAIRAVMPGR